MKPKPQHKPPEEEEESEEPEDVRPIVLRLVLEEMTKNLVSDYISRRADSRTQQIGGDGGSETYSIRQLRKIQKQWAKIGIIR